MSFTADEWLTQVSIAVQQHFPQARLDADVVRFTRVTVRVVIDEDRFADLFFREETERTDYALIVNGKRAFGLDNLGGWHEHPLNDPEGHVPCAEPTPAEAVRRLREVSDSLARQGDNG